MDGQYLNNEQYKEYLLRWTDEVINKQLWKNHVDLHINAIASEFNNKQAWVHDGLYLFGLLKHIMTGRPYECILTIPLSYSSIKTNISDLQLDYVTTHVDMTPPSFYLFPVGNKNYQDTIYELLYLPDLTQIIGYRVYFKEELDTEGEYYRCIYIN